MRDHGPWGDAIMRMGTADKAAYVAHLKRLDAAGLQQRFEDALSADCLEHYVGNVDLDHHILLAVVVDGDVRATIELCPIAVRRVASTQPSTAFRAAMSVEPNWRSRGMGQALLLRAVSAVRHAGGKTLVIDQLNYSNAFRIMATRFAAELWFDDVDCQAWFDISPDAELQARPLTVVAKCS
jgi:GNAT superfamily N-acetyltransferase